ncbi:HD family phosphohydrolase [Sporosarcina sp. G11-34]|uniref:HD family phosphohydrolase n=1 Tax=Sporosarcina sp. G11-34 TaxID=2849605 RepID=UPI0022A981A3|nr:HD family phosphohydrolase [Sporosarcina sp. G11-34]MCZ2259358.1 HD family phosphohydrolase [Sporosarcina sp. G11-34]
MFRSISHFLKSLKFNYLSLFLIGLFAVFLFAFLYGGVKKETYELTEFQISPQTIRSIKTIEDTAKTEEERERAALEVGPVYQFSEDIAKNRQAIIVSLFDLVIEVKTTAENEAVELGEPSKGNKELAEILREKLVSLEEKEPSMLLGDDVINKLLSQDIAVLLSLQKTLASIIGEELSKPVRTGDITSVKYEVERKLRFTDSIPPTALQAAIAIGRSAIVETEMVNEEATQMNIEQAKAAVEPTRILLGQVIVREGQVIDREVYKQLKLLGLLTNQSTVKPIAGSILFVLLVSSIIYMHFVTWKATSAVKKKALLIVLTIFFLLVILMKLIALIEPNFDIVIAFLFPTALAPLLVKLLTNERLAVMTTIITAATAGVILQESFASIIQMEVALYILFGGITSLYLLGSGGRRTSILGTSLGVAISNLIFIGFYLLMTQSSYELSELLFYAIAAATSGILSGALTIGLMPFFESVFKIMSDMRLIELSNPNHPLLKKVLTETPGTYHHSVMVANLSDAACESIGANGLLARVGSYYHDIGKTIRPNYFIENQHSGQNPHDKLSPERSRDIIIAHAEEGANLLEKHKMPTEIIDIARQHHGTSLLKFFFVKARDSGDDVTEDEYRYAGPKPQTKEIAIISIADSVEAAVRSMKEPTVEKIATLVRAIVKDKLNDGQFDECDLSMKELREVEKVICKTLNGIFHNRIEYPK